MKEAEKLLTALRGILAMDKDAYRCAWASLIRICLHLFGLL